uniref:Putative secreted protein n=1 Tax=Anopheles darlingi TaxID=43151 RepID=A0A2M4DGJ3_ANODA
MAVSVSWLSKLLLVRRILAKDTHTDKHTHTHFKSGLKMVHSFRSVALSSIRGVIRHALAAAAAAANAAGAVWKITFFLLWIVLELDAESRTESAKATAHRWCFVLLQWFRSYKWQTKKG